MTDRMPIRESAGHSRRAVLAGIGTSAAAPLAGCLGDDEPERNDGGLDAVVDCLEAARRRLWLTVDLDAGEWAQRRLDLHGPRTVEIVAISERGVLSMGILSERRYREAYTEGEDAGGVTLVHAADGDHDAERMTFSALGFDDARLVVDNAGRLGGVAPDGRVSGSVDLSVELL